MMGIFGEDLRFASKASKMSLMLAEYVATQWNN